MKTTREQRQKSFKVLSQSDAHIHKYLGGPKGLWVYYFKDRPSELLTMAEMEAKADGGG